MLVSHALRSMVAPLPVRWIDSVQMKCNIFKIVSKTRSKWTRKTYWNATIYSFSPTLMPDMTSYHLSIQMRRHFNVCFCICASILPQPSTVRALQSCLNMRYGVTFCCYVVPYFPSENSLAQKSFIFIIHHHYVISIQTALFSVPLSHDLYHSNNLFFLYGYCIKLNLPS